MWFREQSLLAFRKLDMPSELLKEKVGLTLNSFNSTDTISTELVEVTLSDDIINTDKTFIVTA